MGLSMTRYQGVITQVGQSSLLGGAVRTKRPYVGVLVMATLVVPLLTACSVLAPAPDARLPADAPAEAVASTMTALAQRFMPVPSGTTAPEPSAAPTGTPAATRTLSGTSTPLPSPTPTPTDTPLPTPDIPEGWQEHADITDRFTFWAPGWLGVYTQGAGKTTLLGGRLLVSVSIVEDPECVQYVDTDEGEFVNCCVERAADAADDRGWNFRLKQKGAVDAGPHRVASIEYIQTRDLGAGAGVATACVKEVHVPFPQTGQMILVMCLVEDAQSFSEIEEACVAGIVATLRAEE